MGKMKLRSASPQSTGPGASPSSTSRLPAGTNGGDDVDADPSSRGASLTANRAVAALSEGKGSPERKRTDGGKVTLVDEKSSKAQGQALEFAIGQIKKKCGQGSVMFLGADFKANVDVITTGVLSLDHALGVGGIPRGRVIEIFGPESSGKTTLTLHLVANAQRAGGNAAFIDAEHALDPSYAKRLGVNLDTLLVSQPDSGEQALEIAEMLISSNAMAIVVIDSVAALVPRAELDGEMGDSHVGLQARLMSQALRKLTAVVNKTNTCLVFINQIREKIGVMFGSPETTTGGRALKFYSSVRLDIRRITSIKDGEEVKGNRTRVKVVKNKVAPPFRQSEFDILFDRGISRAGDLVDLAVEHSVIQRSGTWHSRGEMRLGQGRDRAVQFLEENPDVLRQVDEELRAKLGLPASTGS